MIAMATGKMHYCHYDILGKVTKFGRKQTKSVGVAILW